MSEKKSICPVCRKGSLRESTFSRSFFPSKKEVTVELLTCKCDHCGETTTLSSQHIQNIARLAARKSQYAEKLMGQEYLTLRKRYGLTQQAASKIFGKGIIAFSRYENEDSYPDDSTRLLIELAIERPEVLKSLADKAGVALPLWKERCEDEQRIKVRPFSVSPTRLPTVTREDAAYQSGFAAISPGLKTSHVHVNHVWKSDAKVPNLYEVEVGTGWPQEMVA